MRYDPIIRMSHNNMKSEECMPLPRGAQLLHEPCSTDFSCTSHATHKKAGKKLRLLWQARTRENPLLLLTFHATSCCIFRSDICPTSVWPLLTSASDEAVRHVWRIEKSDTGSGLLPGPHLELCRELGSWGAVAAPLPEKLEEGVVALPPGTRPHTMACMVES
eukprot:299138-Pelagomonas_calceolata.AAC.4